MEGFAGFLVSEDAAFMCHHIFYKQTHFSKTWIRTLHWPVGRISHYLFIMSLRDRVSTANVMQRRMW